MQLSLAICIDGKRRMARHMSRRNNGVTKYILKIYVCYHLVTESPGLLSIASS